MPLTRESLATEAQSYANLGIFIGPVEYTTPLEIDISGLTSNEVDSDGYLKPGVPFTSSGVLVSDLAGDFEALISGGAAGNHTVTGIKTADRLVSVVQIAREKTPLLIDGGAAGDLTATGVVAATDRLLSVRQLPQQDQTVISGGAAGDLTVTGVVLATDRLISVLSVSRQLEKNVSGAAAGDMTVTGIKTTDVLVRVYDETADTDLTSEFTITATDTINNAAGTSSAGDVVTVTWTRPGVDLTSEFSITADDTINNAGGTATTGEQLQVTWETPAVDLTSEFSITADDTINNAGGSASTGEQLEVRYETQEVDLTSEFSITAANTINNAGGTATTGEQLRVKYESDQSVFGVTVAPVRVGYYSGSYGNSSTILNNATDVSVAVAVRGVINKAIAEDAIGRSYTANELAAFAQPECHLTLIS